MASDHSFLTYVFIYKQKLLFRSKKLVKLRFKSRFGSYEFFNRLRNYIVINEQKVSAPEMKTKPKRHLLFYTPMRIGTAYCRD